MAFILKGNLSQLLDVSYETREIDGVPQQCIVIPLEKNGLSRSSRNGSVRFSLGMFEKRPNPFRQTHYLSWMLPTELYREYKELGLADRFTFFGSAKLTNRKSERKYAGTAKSLDEILKNE